MAIPGTVGQLVSRLLANPNYLDTGFYCDDPDLSPEQVMWRALVALDRYAEHPEVIEVRAAVQKRLLDNSKTPEQQGFSNGGGGIRTPGTLSGTPVFKTGPFNHSGTPPGSAP